MESLKKSQSAAEGNQHAVRFLVGRAVVGLSEIGRPSIGEQEVGGGEKVVEDTLGSKEKRTLESLIAHLEEALKILLSKEKFSLSLSWIRNAIRNEVFKHQIKLQEASPDITKACEIFQNNKVTLSQAVKSALINRGAEKKEVQNTMGNLITIEFYLEQITKEEEVEARAQGNIEETLKTLIKDFKNIIQTISASEKNLL